MSNKSQFHPFAPSPFRQALSEIKLSSVYMVETDNNKQIKILKTMKIIRTNTKHLAANERQLIGLLYSCPLVEPIKSCVLFNTRKFINSDYVKAIKSFEKKKIPELLSEHEKCLVSRIKSNYFEPITKNKNLKLFKEIACLIWTKNGTLDFLTAELKKMNWIKSQSNFAKLFGNTDINLKVYWNIKYKYELAYLLFNRTYAKTSLGSFSC